MTIYTSFIDEKKLIESILTLYNEGQMVELDPTYSKGRFYDGLNGRPKLKFDLNPQTEDVMWSNCTSLPLSSESVKSIMFDPPFVIGSGKTTTGIMRNRFSAFKNVGELTQLYTRSLIEFRRVLVDGGIVIFKCQDTVTSGKQLFSHVLIINTGIALDYIVEDLFVLTRERAIIDPRWTKQYHARKNHCYYIVLRKKGNK